MNDKNKDDIFSNIGTKIKNYFNKGIEVSKKGIETAGKAITDFSDKSVLQFELKQLNGKLKDQYAELGKIVFTNKKFNSSSSVEKNLCKNIDELKKQIKQHEKEIKVYEKENESSELSLKKNSEKKIVNDFEKQKAVTAKTTKKEKNNKTDVNKPGKKVTKIASEKTVKKTSKTEKENKKAAGNAKKNTGPKTKATVSKKTEKGSKTKTK